VREDRLVAAAEAGLLVAAERRGRVAFAEAVDGDDAGPDFARQLDRVAQAAGIDGRRQAVVGVVGKGDRLGER
jgi:hypothetical protein